MAAYTEDPSRKGQVIPLTVRVESDSEKDRTVLKYDHNALKQFFGDPALAGRPMVIVSIAGAMRSGKSFILNFFLRYLKNNGWENENWIGDDDVTLSEGITWRGGTEPETRGINVWNEVFIVPGPNGKEVAVVLMDTQGLFDHDTTREDNMKLFALSTLASSVQILNIQGLIEERDLDSLYLCVEIANAALQKGYNSVMQLQTLTVLIRDWRNEHQHKCGLDGGNAYLNKILSKRSDTTELDEVRHQLRNSFSDLQCFLLTHPGLIVNKVAKFKGTNGELEEDFLTQVKELVTSILRPEKLTIKLCGGEPMTSRRLLNLLTACDNVFLSGKLPKPESLVEAFAKSHYSTIYQENLNVYQTKMEDFIDSEIAVTDNKLTEKHTAVFEECLKLYDSCPKIGSDSVRKEFRKHLEKQCKIFFKNFAEHVRNNQAEMMIRIRNASDAAEDQYKQTIVESIGAQSMPDRQLHEEHQVQFAKAISMFESTTANFGRKANESKLQLEQKLTRFYNLKREENKKKRQIEEELKNEKDKLKLHHLVEELCNEFEEEMNKLGKQYMDEINLKKKHSGIGDRLTQRYQQEASAVSRDLIEEYKGKFLEKIHRKEKESNEKNEENKQLLIEALENKSDKLATDYKKKMLKMLEDAHYGDAKLFSEHEKLLEQYVEDFKNFDKFPQDCDLEEPELRLREKINALYPEVEEVNKENKTKRGVKIENLKDVGKVLWELAKSSGPAIGLILRKTVTKL